MNRVSYIVAAYKAAPFLEKCVKSLHQQQLPTGWDYEILIGVDACPDTLEVAKRLVRPNVRVFEMLTHSGPFVTANTLVEKSTGNWLFRVDADDWCLPGRTKRMLSAAVRNNARMVNSMFKEVNLDGSEIKEAKKPAEGSWAYRRDLWDAIGGWEAWECAADSMLLAKARRLEGGNEAVVKMPLYIRLLHPDQITADPLIGKNTVARENRRKQIAKEMRRMASGHLPRVTQRVVGEAREIMQEGEEPRPGVRVTASLASIPDREKELEKTVLSLIPQVDQLNVYLNNYHQVPAFLKHDKITVARSQEHGDLGDAGKFFWADEVRGVHLTCDDDIIYPHNYARSMLEALRKHNWKTAVSHHGRTLPEKPVRYYRGHLHMWHCGHVSEGGTAHVLGTGVLAYHTDFVRPSLSDFPKPNMADVCFGLYCQREQIPCVCLPHAAGWIQIQEIQRTIWSASHHADGTAMDTRAQQDKAVKRAAPWVLHEPRAPRVHVAITTYNRPETVLGLLKDLALESALSGFEVDVRVYDDCSPTDYSEVEDYCAQVGFVYSRQPKNLGLERHCELITQAYEDMRDSPAEFFLVLPDDCRLLPGFFENCLNAWAEVTDPHKVSMAVAVLNGREESADWSGIPTVETNGGVQVGWVDGFNWFNREYLTTLNYEVKGLKSNRAASSGMGRGITKSLVAAKKTMYRVRNSLVVSLDLPSQMHPKVRNKTPLPTVKHVQEPTLPPCRLANQQGIKINVLKDDLIGETLLAGGYYELDLLQAVRDMGIEGVYVDVGAFVGTHALWFAKKCPSTKVLAIEPQAGCVAMLRNSAKANGLSDKIEVVYGAVHNDLPRVAIEQASADNRGMSKVREGDGVVAWRLDALLENVENAALIKLDVEGLEENALRSAAKTIEKHKPILITEAWDRKALNRLRSLLKGYKHSGAYGKTPTYIWTPTN